jgi:RES domain-containing protein
MDVYRITKEKYIHDLEGEGARIHGGRWNQKGYNVLYTSEHESVAVLEVLAHTPITSIPTDLKLMVLSIPDHVSRKTVEIKSLPANWRKYPAPDILAERGTNWLRSASSLLLKVPSVITPSEHNFLINPAHKEFQKVKPQACISHQEIYFSARRRKNGNGNVP